MNINLEEVIGKIIQQTQKPKKDILARIEAKKEDLGGLITDEGAACIVAKELGVEIFEEITYKRSNLQIKDLTVGMNSIAIVGLVDSLNPVYEFTRKNGKKGKLAKFRLIDPTGQVPVVLWGDHTKLVSEGTLQEQAVIKIRNTYVKEGRESLIELHVGRQGKIEFNPKNVDLAEFDNLSTETPLIKIDELRARMWNVHLIGKIQWKSQITTFNRQDGTGQVASLNIFDETGDTRVALWDAHAPFVDQVTVNDVVTIYDGYTREGRDESVELHVGRKSQIKKEGSLDVALPERSPQMGASGSIEVQIKDLTSHSKNITVVGKVIEKQEAREVTFKDSSIHRVCNALFADETGCIILSIWDEDIEKTELGATYCVENGYISVFRGMPQLNIGKYGIFKPSEKTIETINQENNLSEISLEATRKYIMDIEENELVEILGTIVSIQERKPLYDSCPNCKKKVTSTNNKTWTCEKCGEIPEAIPRMLWSFTLDDGTDNIRVTVIDKVGEKLLGLSAVDAKKIIDEDILENVALSSKLKEILGKKVIITGNIRFSDFTSKLEIIANSVSYPDPRVEMTKLLARVESYT